MPAPATRPARTSSRNDCDYWFVDYLSDYRLWEQNVEQAAVMIADMNSRAAHYGRSIAFGMSCHVICADTKDKAIELADNLEEHGKTNRIAFIAAKALGPGLVGTPEMIADRIRRYEAAGVGTLMMHFHPMMEGMEQFARQSCRSCPNRSRDTVRPMRREPGSGLESDAWSDSSLPNVPRALTNFGSDD